MITVIDLSSDDETLTPTKKGKHVVSTTTATQEQKNQQQTAQRCQTSQPKSKGPNNDNNFNKIDGKKYDFIDHVMMIWLNRVRSGYKNLEMPDNILKAKAKEAAIVLDLADDFSPNFWFSAFQKKINEIQKQNLKTIDTGNRNVFRIEEIIREEKPKFFRNCTSNKSNGISLEGKTVISKEEENLTKRLKEIEDNQQKQLSKMLDEQKKHLEKVKEAQRQQMEQVKEAQKQRDENLRKQEETRIKIAELHKNKTQPNSINIPLPSASSTIYRFNCLRKATTPEVIDVDDVLDDPIQSYEEALDCLALVENYFLSTRNFNAVMFINQIEGFLKKQIDS